MNILTSAMFNPSALKTKHSFDDALRLAGLNPLNMLFGGTGGSSTTTFPSYSDPPLPTTSLLDSISNFNLGIGNTGFPTSPVFRSSKTIVPGSASPPPLPFSNSAGLVDLTGDNTLSFSLASSTAPEPAIIDLTGSGS